MSKEHHYTLSIKWTGNKGKGTADYTAYSRDHDIKGPDKVVIPGSSDPSFRGAKERYNPEELFLSSISSCHMLWYLHLCTVAKITVLNYEDNPEGIMSETENGSGQFDKVVLKPIVSIKEGQDVKLAETLHQRANEYCFISNSLNFKVEHQVTVILG